MTRTAADVGEELLACLDVRVLGVSSRRRSQGLEVEDHVGDGAARDLGIRHVVRRSATGDRVEQVLRKQVARDAHVLEVGAHGLVQKVDGQSLLTEAPDVAPIDHGASGSRIGRPPGVERQDRFDQLARLVDLQAAADSISVRVARVCQRDQRRVVHRVQEPEAGHRRWQEARHAGSHGRHFLGRVTRNRTMLELRPPFLDQRIESRRLIPPEAEEHEGRMPLSVSDVALLARGRDEDGAESVGHAETPRELLVTSDVLAHLRGGHALDRPVQELILRTSIRRQNSACRTCDGGDEREADERRHWRNLG